MLDYIQNLNNRYATKQFDPSYKLSKEQENILDQTLDLAPSSFGLQPYKVIKVVNTQIRQKLKEASWDQTQITDASVLYVLCARKDINQTMIKEYVELTAKTRGVEMESLSGYEKMMNGFIQALPEDQKTEWAKKQVYIALGFLLDAAAQNGLDACPLEGFDAKAYTDILELEEKNLVVSVVCAVGVRSKEDMYATLPKVRLGTEKLIINM